MNPSFENITFDRVAVMEIGDNKVLILICSDKPKSLKLHANIKAYPYRINIKLMQSKQVRVEVDFLNSEYLLYLDTGITPDNYPPFQWLLSGQVELLTTGIKSKDNVIWWNQDYLGMMSPSLN